MKIIKNNILKVLVVVACFNLPTFAQTKSQNNDIWLHYVGKNMLTKKLSFTLEATMRFANGFSQKQQYFIRPSFDYQLTKHFTGSVGFTL
jgi:nitrate reductase alpha subunit